MLEWSLMHTHLHTFSLFTIIFTLYKLYLFLTYLASFSAITTRWKQRLEPSDSQTLVSMLPGYCAVINLVIVWFHRLEDRRRSDNFVFEHLYFFFISRDKPPSTSISFTPAVLLFSLGLRIYIALYSGVFGTSL